jgi:hypothetical protein
MKQFPLPFVKHVPSNRVGATGFVTDDGIYVHVTWSTGLERGQAAWVKVVEVEEAAPPVESAE